MLSFIPALINYVSSLLSSIFDVAGLSLVVWGAGVALFKIAVTEVKLLSKKDHYLERGYDKLREDLAYRMILGLELFLAGDVIRLIAVPTQETLLRIGAVIVIRTVLVVVLNYEVGQSHHGGSGKRRGGIFGSLISKLRG
ncbi:DUF1622 domain-containing protein [Candidatus Saccharibacteria bacterium]|nr:DUF1622 domain-containing protein [Candidatus Saccharibacteria bacterium]